MFFKPRCSRISFRVYSLFITKMMRIRGVISVVRTCIQARVDTALAEVFGFVFQVFHIHPSFGRQEVSKIFIDQSEAG